METRQQPPRHLRPPDARALLNEDNRLPVTGRGTPPQILLPYALTPAIAHLLPWAVGWGFLGRVRDEKGAYGGHGNHDDADAGLGLDPEGFPRRVDGSVDDSRGCTADSGDDDHEDAEAKRCPQSEFLTELQLGLPEEQDGN